MKLGHPKHVIQRSFLKAKSSFYKPTLKADPTSHSFIDDHSFCSVSQYSDSLVESTKFLGIHFDRRLTFDEHILYIINKLKKFIPTFYRLRDLMPQKTLRLIFEQLCVPMMRYCLLAYGNGSKLLLNKLQRKQKILIKIMHRKEGQSLKLDFYKNEEFMNIETMYEYELLILAYKIKYQSDILPVPFKEYVMCSRRHNENFQIPLCRTSLEQKTSTFTIPFKWNMLPVKIKTAKSIREFKRNLKLHLIEKMISF